jgi:hypothetical protein
VVGVTEPSPFSVSVTFVAPPPNLLPLIVTDVNPQVLPLVLLKVTVAGFTHCPDPSLEINVRRQATRKTNGKREFLLRNILLLKEGFILG